MIIADCEDLISLWCADSISDVWMNEKIMTLLCFGITLIMCQCM